MAVGFSSDAADDILDTFVGTYDYIQLHVGDPGSAGTSNVAGNTTRKAISWGSASGGSVANDTAISWDSGEVDTTEDYTHYTLWDASTSGNFGQSGTVTANAVTAGDTFTIPIGDLTLTVTSLAS